jgi:hypothetical protein
MKPAGWFLTLLCEFGLLAMAAPQVPSQASRHDVDPLPATEAAAYPAWNDAVPVQAVLHQFDSALAMHDVGMLQAAGVRRADAKRWQEFFRNNPRATVTDQCPLSDLFISDASAIWNCTETATVISEGKPRSFVHFIRFTFARNHGTWMVADRR